MCFFSPIETSSVKFIIYFHKYKGQTGQRPGDSREKLLKIQDGDNIEMYERSFCCLMNNNYSVEPKVKDLC